MHVFEQYKRLARRLSNVLPHSQAWRISRLGFGARLASHRATPIPSAPRPPSTLSLLCLSRRRFLHGTEGIADDGATSPATVRSRGEAVALLLTESLGLDDAHYCRGYIQGWLAEQTIPEWNTRRIFAPADKMLRAGYPIPTEKGE